MESDKTIHIVTAFHRINLKEKLTEMLGKFKIIWHPVCDIDVYFKENWIQAIKATPPDEWDKCYWKINNFIKTQKIIDKDYYMILNDDDSIEQNVISEIKKMDNDIVVVSMKRGDKIPQNAKIRHETSTCIASQEYMKVGYIGPEQIIFKGKIFKTLQYENYTGADGKMAEKIKNEIKDIAYRPDLFILFNYYEQGRYFRQ